MGRALLSLLALGVVAPVMAGVVWSAGPSNGPDVTTQAPQGQSDEGGADAALQTFGSHQYWVSQEGHPAETALAASPTGTVFLADTSGVKRTTNGGQTWDHIGLLPPNLGIGIVPEGDVVVAPNGDVFTNWLAINEPHSAVVWKSTTDGQSWTVKPVDGPQPFPDRPWIIVSAMSPPDPGNPLAGGPYIGAMVAGFPVKPTWFSRDGGETWIQPAGGIGPLTTSAPFPTLTSNPYLDFAKPFGQGFSGTRFIALPGGEIYDVSAKRWTTDWVHFKSLNNPGLFPTAADWTYWDSSSDGKLYGVRIVDDGGWKIQYGFYDGTSWQDGAVSVPLAAKPDYANGLNLGGGGAVHSAFAAIKSHGTMLGINTREGSQDVLIRISNAASGSPTFTKELIGGGSADRYDFPNLAFDAQGRAVVSFNSSWVAYATAP